MAQVLDSNKNLQKVLYYGYGGAGDITGSYLSGKSAEEKYVYTTSQPAMPMQVRQDLQDVSMKIW